ncbi:hypothetical protein Tco_1193908 [Tanacetum coccineum]
MRSMIVKNNEVDGMAHERWLRGEDYGFDSKEDEVVPKVDDVSLVDGVFDGALGGDVDDVSLVDGVFDGALGGDGDEDFAIGEGV